MLHHLSREEPSKVTPPALLTSAVLWMTRPAGLEAAHTLRAQLPLTTTLRSNLTLAQRPALRQAAPTLRLMLPMPPLMTSDLPLVMSRAKLRAAALQTIEAVRCSLIDGKTCFCAGSRPLLCTGTCNCAGSSFLGVVVDASTADQQPHALAKSCSCAGSSPSFARMVVVSTADQPMRAVVKPCKAAGIEAELHRNSLWHLVGTL